METFGELLQWLTNGGGAALLVAWAVAWWLEGWGKWDALDSKVKSGIILAISVVLGLIATWVSSLPEGTLALIEPYMNTVIAVIGIWISTQTAHKLDPVARVRKFPMG